ncbi:hypothetical protein V6R21_07465 [Limibacter armeniacum]|uniref:hypothetical protein n=1 Tax=Limibacter armeniacum TaxID=466084 RepID=UPI002FE5A795
MKKHFLLLFVFVISLLSSCSSDDESVDCSAHIAKIEAFAALEEDDITCEELTEIYNAVVAAKDCEDLAAALEEEDVTYEEFVGQIQLAQVFVCALEEQE